MLEHQANHWGKKSAPSLMLRVRTSQISLRTVLTGGASGLHPSGISSLRQKPQISLQSDHLNMVFPYSVSSYLLYYKNGICFRPQNLQGKTMLSEVL